MVTTPAGEHFSVVDPALAAELGDGVTVLKQDRGVFDTMPLSLITTQPVASLGALVNVDLDVQRFRPNLLIEAADDSPFPRTPGSGAPCGSAAPACGSTSAISAASWSTSTR